MALDNKMSYRKTSERNTSENQKENYNSGNNADDSVMIMRKLNLGNVPAGQRNNLLAVPTQMRAGSVTGKASNPGTQGSEAKNTV